MPYGRSSLDAMGVFPAVRYIWYAMIHDKLFSYQIQDRDALLSRKTAILAEQIGAGKTVIAMSVMDKLWQASLADKILVVAQNSTIPQWCDMLRDWLGVEPFPVLGGSGKEKRYHKYEWFRNSLHHPVLIINYSSLRTDLPYLMNLGFKCVFLDEATMIKGLDSATAMSARQLTLSCDYRYLMTGTPVQNNLLELFALMAAVEPKILGSYWNFRSQFLVEQDVMMPVYGQGIRTFKKIVGYKNIEKLAVPIQMYCIRNGYGEVQDKLPEVVVENRFVELSPAQKVKYNEIAGGLLVMGTEFKRVNFLERLVRLFECCDSLKMLGDVEDRSAKIDEVINLLDGELKGVSTIVFSQYREPVRSIQKRLNALDIPSVVIDGDVPVELRAKAQADFNEGRAKVLIMTTAGEMGLNLQGGSCIIMLDRMWNPARNKQIIGRINRVGQSHKSIVVINIIARNTVDEGVFKVLKKKIGLVNEIFEEQDLNALGIEQIKCLVRGEAEHLM